MKFIIANNEDQKQKLIKQGFSYFKEEKGEFWFLFDGKVGFNSDEYKIINKVNL